MYHSKTRRTEPNLKEQNNDYVERSNPSDYSHQQGRNDEQSFKTQNLSKDR
jgi:hypothetical protein